MRTWTSLQTVAVLLATFALVIPSGVFAVGDVTQAPVTIPQTDQSDNGAVTDKIVDVSLGYDGALRGQLLDGNGQAVAGTTIALVQLNRVTAITRTDKAGRYAFENVRSGSYLLQSPSASRMCRVWTTNTAPPNAIPQALLVEGQSVVRGNVMAFLGNPWVLGLLAAAAIAIPLSIRRKKS